MKFTPEVIAALQILRDNAENDFERHRLDVLERDLTAPPQVEVIDDTHQRFNDFIFHQKKDGHYAIGISIQRVIWQYHHGKIPEGEYEIHHRDLNPANNSSENLQLLTRTEHQKLHSQITEPQTCICETCGETFLVQNRRRKHSRFCSLACRNVDRKNNSKYKEIRTCVMCGKDFIADKYKPTQCCSITCSRKYNGLQHRETLSEKICPICNKNFIPSKQKQICCSKSCAAKLRCQNRFSNEQ